MDYLLDAEGLYRFFCLWHMGPFTFLFMTYKPIYVWFIANEGPCVTTYVFQKAYTGKSEKKGFG